MSWHFEYPHVLFLHWAENILTDWDILSSSDFVQEGCSEMSSESREAGDDLVVALFNLLSCLNNVPEALTHVLQQYLERAQLWGHLYTLAGEVTNSCFIMLEFRGSLLQTDKTRHGRIRFHYVRLWWYCRRTRFCHGWHSVSKLVCRDVSRS